MADIGFWKQRFATFEQATPLAFGQNDVGVGKRDWTLSVDAPGRDQLVAAWALLLSRCSGEGVVTLGFQSSGNAETNPLRLDVDESLDAVGYLKAISQQLSEQLDEYLVTEKQLRSLMEWPNSFELYESTVFQTLEIRGTGRFSDATLKRISDHLGNLIQQLSENEFSEVRKLDHLSRAERQQLFEGWQFPPVPYPDLTVHALFEKRVAERPDAVAVVCEAESLTYAELNARANRLAYALLEKGTGQGQYIALLLERGIDQIVAIMGILKVGAAYVPVDIALPHERVAGMLDDAGAVLAVSHSSITDQFRGLEKTTLVLIDSEQPFLDENPEVPCSQNDPAYVIFTSGSTGRPKGVEMPHRGVVSRMCSTDYMGLSPETILLQMASISFDVSVYDIWSVLLHGGTLVLCPYKVPALDQLKKLILKHKVNTMVMTTAFFHLIIKEDPQVVAPLNYLLVGGEAMQTWHVGQALKTIPGTRVINGYGPSENSIISSYHVCEESTFNPDLPIPIGRPVPNTTCYVLDRFKRPVGIGVLGELHVGGSCVACGYIGRPELTAERFMADPFSDEPDARIYNTGDLVHWNPEGQMEFVGRVDNQVKVRGFRIELSEIEGALSEFSGVEQGVVVLHEDEVRGKWLAGYVKTDAPESFPIDGLKKFISGKLPEYMVPSALVAVKQWAYTHNGKIDRKALPKPELGAVEAVAYKSETEIGLAEIWKGLLGIDVVPRDMGFFELGGDSLLAVTLFLKIHQHFGRDYTLATLLAAPTLETLAREIDGASEDAEHKSLKLIRKGDDSLPPLFWFHGGDGHVLLFKRFTDNFDTDQTIYAFQYAGLDGRPGEPTVEAMAQAYLTELLAVCPKGKVRLGGYCIGGYVVMEVARLLKGSGVEVLDPVVVAGSPNMHASSFLPREPETSAKSMAAFDLMCAEMERCKVVADAPIHRDYAAPKLRWPKNTALYGHARRMRTWNRLMRTSQSASEGEPIEPASRGWYCGNITTLAGERHKSRGYDGDMLYFRSGVCHGSAMNFRGWWSSLFMGFEELCRGSFEGIVVGGLHEDMLKRPEVAAIVKDRFEKNG